MISSVWVVSMRFILKQKTEKKGVNPYMISDRLRQIRKEHKLTQQNVADVLGVDRTTYTVYELGTTTPSTATLVKLSQIYNVTVGYLIGVEENNPSLRKDLPSDKNEQVLKGDPIALLKKDEKELLLYFRILSSEEKKKVTEEIKNLAKNGRDRL